MRQIVVNPKLRRIAQVFWVGLIIVFVVIYLWQNWQTFQTYEWEFNPWWLLLALFWTMVRRLLGGVRWVLIALYERERRTWQAILDQLRVYFLSNLANYIPGSVWYMASRIQMSRQKGLSTLRVSAGLVYETGTLVWSGCVVGAFSALTVFPQNRTLIVVLTIFVAIVSVLILYPKVVNFLVYYLLQILRRPPARVEITFSWGILVWLVSIGVWVTGGLTLFFLIKAFYSTLPSGLIFYVTSVSALAWTIGFLTPWAPSGLGIRDGLLVWLLAVYMPTPMAVVATVAARLVTVIEDIGWAVIVLVFWRR